MIRRKKEEVLKQLPDRVDKHFFVPMTKEQQEIHDENYEIVVSWSPNGGVTDFCPRPTSGACRSPSA